MSCKVAVYRLCMLFLSTYSDHSQQNANVSVILIFTEMLK